MSRFDLNILPGTGIHRPEPFGQGTKRLRSKTGNGDLWSPWIPDQEIELRLLKPIYQKRLRHRLNMIKTGSREKIRNQGMKIRNSTI